MGTDWDRAPVNSEGQSYLDELKRAAKALASSGSASPTLKAALNALSEAERTKTARAIERAQSSLALALAELSDEHTDSLAMALGGEHRRETELTRVLLMLLRLLRARQGRATGAEHALTDLYKGLTRLLEERGEISLRVAVDGLYMGDRPVLKVSPEDDPALFRVFQHGIRQLAFFPGLDVDELEQFVDVLTTEMTAAQAVEEDISTLLADKEFAGIQFLVVETFTEAVDGSGRDRAADVADIVSAALRQQLTDELDASQGSGGAVRFWSADVTFIKENNLKELIAALPKGDHKGALGRIDDDDLAAFGRHLEASLERWTPWLPEAVLSLLEGASEREAAALYPLLRTQLLADARINGLGAVLSQLDQISTWLRTRQGQPQAEALIHEVFNPGLRALALKALTLRDPDGQSAARLVMAHLPRDERFRTLNEVLLFPQGQARRHAVRALLEGEGTPVAQLTEIIATVEYELAWTILHHFRDDSFAEELLALHYRATKHEEPKVRALALRWLALRGGDHATNALRNALYDDDEEVRGASLYLLAAVKHPLAGKFVADWFNSSEFKRLEMPEKRLGAQTLAMLSGGEAIPQLRKLLNRKNVTLMRTVDEIRAAALVALVMLGDAESEATIAKLATSRFAGQALKTEASRVAAAREAGRAPYGSPFRKLNKLALHLRLVDRSSDTTTRPPATASVQMPVGSAQTPFPVGSVQMPVGSAQTPFPDGSGQVRVTEDRRAEARIKLARELLESISYDDLPLTGADAD